MEQVNDDQLADLEKERHVKLLTLLQKDNRYKSIYTQFRDYKPPQSFYEELYTKFPTYGLTWDATDYLGKVFCPQDRLAGLIMLYLFANITQEGGHTCADAKTFFDNFKYRNKMLNLDRDDFREAVNVLVSLGSITIKGSTIWHNYWFHSEDSIVHQLREIAKFSSTPLNDPEAFRGELTEKQFDILRSVQTNTLVAVDGLPGTGKTTSAKKIHAYLKANNYQVHLLAPTALAARNLSEKCGVPGGRTIHSFVLRNKEQLQGENAFLIDEFSMVETRIFERFLETIHLCNPKIIFIGDVGQLPSIGAGQLFRDLITLKDKLGIRYHHLDEIMRQAQDSEIVKNSHQIKKGETNLEYKGQFIFSEQDEFGAADSIIKISKKLKELGKDFVILSPTHKGVCGVSDLNNNLRDIFNPLTAEKKETKDGVWRESDRVLVNHNFYDIGLVNGDIGHIEKIVREDEFILNVAGAKYTVYKEVIKHLKLAYALTIHKAQGQEFEYVLMPFVNSFTIQLQRKLFYTAVTRAKKQVYIFGHRAAINKAILSSREDLRRTGLTILTELHTNDQ